MPGLARRNMTTPVMVAAVLGTTGSGAVRYADPVEVWCWPEEDVRVVRGADGEDVTSSTRIWCGPEHYDLLAPGARVTVRDRDTSVVGRSLHDPGAVRLEQLLEVSLL